MLRALKNRIQSLTSLSRTQGDAASGFPAKTARPSQEANQEVIAAVDSFLRRERSYEKRGEIFAALVSQFAENNPVESQVAVMFNAVLEKIVAPMHHSLFWGYRMLSFDKAAVFLEDDIFRRSYEAVRGSHIYD